MNGGILDDFKNAFKRPNSAHYQLIIINVVVFVFMALVRLFTLPTGLGEAYAFVHDIIAIPPFFESFIYRPWTIITYAFAHDLNDILHILMNMLVFYWFAKLIIEYLGNEKVISLYVLGAMAGGIAYLLMYNFIPFYAMRAPVVWGMVGASAAVYAITIAAATLLPNYTFFLMFIGPVKIKYIAGFFIVISLIGSVGNNAGGNVAHLGGALVGYLYVIQMKKGNDWGSWIISVISFFKSFFVKQPNIKVSYKKEAKSKTQSKRTTERRAANSGYTNTSQDEIDAILDKISERGYESLSKEEKQKLFNASKK